VSSPRFRTGLVVGKFAPLHRGHELVIETACRQCESVLVLSYCRPELPGCPPERRRAWLEALFPGVRSLVIGEADARLWRVELPPDQAPAEEHRAFVAHVCHEILGLRIDAVFTSEDYGQPFADALTDYYRARLPNPSRVTHVAVDPARQRVPISGTHIRRAPYTSRRWLNPLVYAALIRRVVMLGAESSGKTTLTRALARARETEHVEEYGRELWVERGAQLDPADLLSIAREQVQREERALPDCRDVLFCDTSPLTTALYSQILFGEVPAELERLAAREYHLTVYCAPDFPLVQDGTRRGVELQSQQDRLTRAELERRGIAYLTARGPVEERTRQVLAALPAEGAVARCEP
jgi:HTH-type transcriptional regulator, transcriptional repressor of NAD biosynthesis genes